MRNILMGGWKTFSLPNIPYSNQFKIYIHQIQTSLLANISPFQTFLNYGITFKLLLFGADAPYRKGIHTCNVCTKRFSVVDLVKSSTTVEVYTPLDSSLGRVVRQECHAYRDKRITSGANRSLVFPCLIMRHL